MSHFPDVSAGPMAFNLPPGHPVEESAQPPCMVDDGRCEKQESGKPVEIWV